MLTSSPSPGVFVCVKERLSVWLHACVCIYSMCLCSRTLHVQYICMVVYRVWMLIFKLRGGYKRAFLEWVNCVGEGEEFDGGDGVGREGGKGRGWGHFTGV